MIIKLKLFLNDTQDIFSELCHIFPMKPAMKGHLSHEVCNTAKNLLYPMWGIL